MRTPLPECCPLCDGVVFAPDMSKHLRALHQVIPGELTIADVPARRTDRARPAPARLERREELVEVGAA